MKENVSKKIKNNLLLIDIILILFVLLTFIFKDSILSLIFPISASFFMLITFLGILLLGYRKNKRNKRKDRVTNTYLTFSIIYLLIIYLAGNATGFNKVDFNIFDFIYLLIIMTFSEIFRYIILNKCSRKTNQQYIITFIYIMIDVFIFSKFTPNFVVSHMELFTVIIISIIKNALLSYTSFTYGFYPCMVYTLIITIMPIIAPIYPNLGNYLSLVSIIVYSALIIFFMNKLTKKKEKDLVEYKKGFIFYFERILFVFTILIIFLVSGNFKYSLSAIASDSMYPEIKRGDAIILERVDEKNRDTLEKGMIVAFEEDGQIITHRILFIDLEDGIEYITTKGDNNTTKDVTKKEKDDIIGIVKFKIPLLGYPSVEIAEIKNKE